MLRGFGPMMALIALCVCRAQADAPQTDPPRDAAYPARFEVLHIPSAAVAINGVAYVASGRGTHPTLVICHGWPGNEKNLDLAQAVRRAGWNAITFNYRGSWGSPGEFHFSQNPEDAAAVKAAAENAETLVTHPEKMADELIASSNAFSLAASAPGLAKIPLLVLTADDRLARIQTQHFTTDHSWSDSRIALQNSIIDWLQTLPK
jgi:pimeloyl-ACP methyl ester carboxylesterase